MKTKEEVIQAAWGKEWDKVKTHIDEWGRLTYQQCYDIWGDGIHSENNFYFEMRSNNFPILFNDTEDGYYYPKVLEGIQTNNGWKSVYGDMPPENSGLYFVYDGKDVGIARMSILQFRTLNSNEVCSEVTHYQPITNPKPPIY